MLILVPLTFAAPPSSVLNGEAGTLAWTVTPSAEGIHIEGRSPKWTVSHDASAQLAPKRTVHQDIGGTPVTLTWVEGGVDVIGAHGTSHLAGANLWDADTLDIRLGAAVAGGRTDFAFSAVDPTAAKVYSFDSAKVGEETCGSVPCTHIRVQLTGVLRWVGPTWEYWYGAGGKLLRFTGPAGDYEVAP